MNNKQQFIELVEKLIGWGVDGDLFIDGEYADALAYFDAFKAEKPKEDKPQFTDNGKLIITYMKDSYASCNNLFKAREIAEGIFISSRSVSGSIRKLVTDGYVEKVGQDPIIYSLTELGKAATINENQNQ